MCHRGPYSDAHYHWSSSETDRISCKIGNGSASQRYQVTRTHHMAAQVSLLTPLSLDITSQKMDVNFDVILKEILHFGLEENHMSQQMQSWACKTFNVFTLFTLHEVNHEEIKDSWYTFPTANILPFLLVPLARLNQIFIFSNNLVSLFRVDALIMMLLWGFYSQHSLLQRWKSEKDVAHQISRDKLFVKGFTNLKNAARILDKHEISDFHKAVT